MCKSPFSPSSSRLHDTAGGSGARLSYSCNDYRLWLDPVKKGLVTASPAGKSLEAWTSRDSSGRIMYCEQPVNLYSRGRRGGREDALCPRVKKGLLQSYHSSSFSVSHFLRAFETRILRSIIPHAFKFLDFYLTCPLPRKCYKLPDMQGDPLKTCCFLINGVLNIFTRDVVPLLAWR